MGRVLQWICRLFLGGLFIVAGYVKIAEPFQFEMAIESYQLLPVWGVIAVARMLPWIEVALGLLLVRGWKLHWFASFCAALLGFFLVTMTITYARGIEATCGCFGLGEPVSPRTLARDTGFFVAAAYLAVVSWRRVRPASSLNNSQ
ncbi:MAG: DoxX family membrane protein [Acidobacteria bacterium]|nr:DoxX family membrane protein [Acidobacteriota bacterium]